MQKQKRVISLILALMLALSCFTCLGSVNAFAAGDAKLQVGDANGDGDVDIDDVTYIQMYLAGRQPGATDEQIKAMDVNGDGDVDGDDITTFQLYLAGRGQLVEPTEPTTAEPTTKAPEEPTTVEPTTEEPVEEAVYSVAGSIAELGSWDATSVATEMTKGDDGKYSFTTAITAQNDVLFKVVKNHSWDTAYGDNGNNVSFNVTKDCDVTITFDPETEEITVTGEGVEQPKELEIEAMRAVGNGEGNWLNGSNWDPADDINLMTEVADGIYEITFENVDASFGYDVKCAANGSWAANWGVAKGSGFKPENGVEFDASWDGDNASFEVDDDGATVKVQIDISNFDLASKTGAKMTITVTYPDGE